jgi:hypothetical protein
MPIPVRFVRGSAESAPPSLSREDITTVQRALNEAGYPCCVTGDWLAQCSSSRFGRFAGLQPCSVNAMRQFHADHGLPATGQIDDLSLDALGVELP